MCLSFVSIPGQPGLDKDEKLEKRKVKPPLSFIVSCLALIPEITRDKSQQGTGSDSRVRNVSSVPSDAPLLFQVLQQNNERDKYTCTEEENDEQTGISKLWRLVGERSVGTCKVLECRGKGGKVAKLIRWNDIDNGTKIHGIKAGNGVSSSNVAVKCGRRGPRSVVPERKKRGHCLDDSILWADTDVECN
ncbi:hypothetical protein WN51_01001 [Melipona quadrifasciata]|uniref:Uncharacterized protein n=1 Tax=Melipona quadrifasciata TaxID=166423 RepID=A0A0M8ZVS6_9HYME|nr:hypothetical protein WN51_01001 [Melipona quadrifasciata]